MFIKDYTVTQNQEHKILEIYNKFKNSFPDCEMINKKDILGIGQPNRHLMCYFLYINSEVMVKFKNNNEKYNIFDKSITEYINQTIALFKDPQLFIRKNPNASQNEKSKFPTDTYISIQIIINTLKDALQNIDEKYDNITFETCSNRLRNVLHRNNIFTIEILKNTSIENILNLKNFGEKCLFELCEYVTKTIKEISIAQKTENKSQLLNNSMQEKYDMLTYINNSRSKIFVCNIKNAFSVYQKNKQLYESIYFELLQYLAKAATLKLAPRELSIFNARYGINEEPKTLQAIGDIHQLTRERVRQIVLKINKKFKGNKHQNLECIQLEYIKYKLFEQFETLPPKGLISYIYFETNNIEQLKLIYTLIFKEKIKFNFIRNELEKQYNKHLKQIIDQQKAEQFNKKIFDLISFNNKRTISDEAYSRLKTERIVNNPDENLVNFTYNNTTYQCESFLEKTILERFLKNNTFKQIKTQSIKIPFKHFHYHPDFQCLTHDNKLVIIEIKPLLNMCLYDNIQKFNTLKEYSEKYGFGYLIIDDRFNSFFEIDEPNNEFNSLILSKLKSNSKLTFDKYKSIYTSTNASLRNLLTLVKSNNLTLSFPFELK